MPSEELSELQESRRQFEEALAETERSLLELKQRYAQYVEQQDKLPASEVKSLRGVLGEIQQKLEALNFYLKFLLFNWGEVKEPFWQVLRFGGLGVVIGWLLKLWAG
jgi:hypothetical protein